MNGERVSQQTQAKEPRVFYGYLMVALAFIIQAVLGGSLYTFSVFFEPLSTQFEWTRAVTSGAFSLYMILHGFLYIFTGKLNDRFGTRIVMTGCGLFMGVGYLLMSQISTVWHLYLFYGVIIAIGMSGGFVPMMSTLTRWFVNHKKRGLMLGIALAGGGFGTMVVPPLANWLISEYGWQMSYRIIGVMVLVVIITAAQFIRRAPGHTGQPQTGKETVGESGAVIPAPGLSLTQAVRTRQFWLISSAYFGFGLVLQAIMVHIVLHANGLGITAATAANIFIVIGALSIAGRIIMGSVSDRLSNKIVLIICFSLMTASLGWLLVSDQAWMLFIFAVGFGFAYGGLVAVQSPIVADFFGMTSHGVILGVIVSIITLGAGIGPVMAGGIFDATGRYFPAFLITIAFAGAALIITLFLKPLTKGGAE